MKVDTDLALRLLICTLATWSITALLVFEDGPFSFFARLRRRAGIRYDEYSNPVATNEFAKMLLCHRCTAMWVALALAALYHSPGASVPDVLLTAIAMRTGSIVIQSLVERF